MLFTGCFEHQAARPAGPSGSARGAEMKTVAEAAPVTLTPAPGRRVCPRLGLLASRPGLTRTRRGASPPTSPSCRGCCSKDRRRRSYPTFPLPFRVSYSIQIPKKTIRVKFKSKLARNSAMLATGDSREVNEEFRKDRSLGCADDYGCSVLIRDGRPSRGSRSLPQGDRDHDRDRDRGPLRSRPYSRCEDYRFKPLVDGG